MKQVTVTSEVLKLTKGDAAMMQSLETWLMNHKINAFADRFVLDVMTCEGPSEDGYGWAGVILDYCKRFGVECPVDFDLSREDWEYEHQLTSFIEDRIIQKYCEQKGLKLVEE